MNPDPVTDGAVAEAVLPVSDLVRSVAFYERLAFRVHAHWPEHRYAIVAFGESLVHLTENPGIDATLSM